jgi:transposase
MHKVLEDANLKLSSVATDVLGVSGRAMLAAIIAGQDDPAALAALAKGRLRNKIADLERALTGRIKDSHRLLLKLHLEHIDDLNAKLGELEAAIDQLLPPFDPDDLLERLDEIPGIDQTTAQIIVAEIGTNMDRFPNDKHLTAWAGLAPGKNESAGRNHSARTLKANRYLRPALVQAAHAAGKTQTYLGERYRRLARRRGKKRAALAVARSMLVIAYHLIRDGSRFIERGAAFFDQLNTRSTQQWLTRRLERLGFKVILQPLETAA